MSASVYRVRSRSGISDPLAGPPACAAPYGASMAAMRAMVLPGEIGHNGPMAGRQTLFDPRTDPRRDSYRRQSLRPLHALVFALPLLAFFHVGSAFEGTGGLFASRDLHRLLGLFGATAWFLPPALVLGTLLIQHVARGDRWILRPGVLVGMLFESVLWAVPIFAVSYLTSRWSNATGSLAAARGLSVALQAAGAGVYEEFLFRLALMGATTWLFADLFRLKRDLVILAALVLSALAFSLYHFSWSPDEAGPAFSWGLFVFYCAAGLCLGVIYAYRGFGIAVGAHTVWNVYYLYYVATGS